MESSPEFRFPPSWKVISDDNFSLNPGCFVKLGLDPTGDYIHLGWLVPLLAFRDLLAFGCQGKILLGSFTASLGDPSGRQKARTAIMPEQIQLNILALQRKIKSLPFLADLQDRWGFIQNQDFYVRTSTLTFFRTIANIPVRTLLERKDFQDRLEQDQPLTVGEFLYPLIQGCDSLYMGSTVEIGGYDQELNILTGRQIASRTGSAPQTGILVPILSGTKGAEKMSQSLDNSIDILGHPLDVFGQIMSISDEKLLDWLYVFNWEKKDWVSDNPRDTKSGFASQVLTLVHGDYLAKETRDTFFQRASSRMSQAVPVKLQQTYYPKTYLSSILVGHNLISSNREAKRLMDQGAVKLNGQVVGSDYMTTSRDLKDAEITIGKRKAYRLMV